MTDSAPVPRGTWWCVLSCLLLLSAVCRADEPTASWFACEHPIRLPPVSAAQGNHDILLPNALTYGPAAEVQSEPSPLDGAALQPIAAWLDDVAVGYDKGFVVASQKHLDLQAGEMPFRLRLNGWGQLRHTVIDSDGPNPDLNQFQLKRARIVFSGNAFTPDFSYFVQLDGRSSSGDNLRLLDYNLSFDVGHNVLGLDRGKIAFKAGKYKMPFTLARYLSGRELEFADRSVASMFFDVNRSLAWGLYGESSVLQRPLRWETAIFNGLVTGGAETGSSGNLDNNFAYSGRALYYPFGQWGETQLADLSHHESPAMRVGGGFATSTIDRDGLTEFNGLLVVDQGVTLASLLPAAVEQYRAGLFAVDASIKYRGLSTTTEYYFRSVNSFRGAIVPDLFDHGFWLQSGYFVVPGCLQLTARWSRVVGNSGTLGGADQSSDEVAGGIVWYLNGQHAKLTVDLTHLNGAPISSSALDIAPGEDGWLLRSQIQFSF